MSDHGIKILENETAVATPNVAKSGVAFVVGAAPAQSAKSPAPANTPVLCTSWSEAVAKLGYSEDWKNYDLCEFMFSHFKLFGCQPVIFCNLLDGASMKNAVPAADIPVSDHKVTLPIEAMDDVSLIVKAAGGTGDAYVKGTDYDTLYSGEHLVVELLPSGGGYDAKTLNVAYSKVNPAAVTDDVAAAGLENIEQCLTTVGMAPDLICAPKHSSNVTVAAIMATKAAGINGMFGAKSLADISTEAIGGATSYTDAITLKGTNNFVDTEQIVCWALLKLGERTFHMSTQLAGLMARVDTGNEGCPYESPSNKGFQCDSMVLASGETVNLTLAQANILNASGIVTALNFMGGWVCWGNNTACYPANTDVKDYFIPVSRMFDWVGNTIIRTFWKQLDKPMNRRLIDTIMDTANIWLSGLVGAGYLLGGRAEFLEAENPPTSLMAGIIKIHVYLTPPSPAQEFDFVLEYDPEYVTSALQA